MYHFIQSFDHYSIPDFNQKWDKAGEVVLVHTKLAPDEEVFADKMIQAFGWPGWVSSHHNHNPDLKTNYQFLWAQKQIRLVILFGISPAGLGLNIQIKLYQLTYLDPFYIYITDPIERLAKNKENKGRIWNDLRTIQPIP